MSAVAVAALAVDHLIGTEADPVDDGRFADPAAFVVGVAVTLGLVALLFGLVVRRARDPEDAASRAIVLSVLGIPAVALAFLGLPFALAGAGIALGLRGRESRHHRLATAAVAIGALVVALVAVGYVVALVR